MIEQGRADFDPLAKVKKLSTRGKETRVRRSLTHAEADALLRVAGPRRVVYLAALLTGLRRNALYNLRRINVRLNDERPHLVVIAADDKANKRRVVWVRDDLAEALRAIMPDSMKPGQCVFAGLLPCKGLGFLRADLAAAGIAERDAQGHRIDFHALRHTACTWAGEQGHSGPLLQSFTGHADLAQVSRYTHDQHLPTLALVEGLPRFDTLIDTPALVASGRGASHADAPGSAASPRKPRRNHGKSRTGSVLVASGRTALGSGAYRDRTDDLLLAKQSLSQLS